MLQAGGPVYVPCESLHLDAGESLINFPVRYFYAAQITKFTAHRQNLFWFFQTKIAPDKQ